MKKNCSTMSGRRKTSPAAIESPSDVESDGTSDVISVLTDTRSSCSQTQSQTKSQSKLNFPRKGHTIYQQHIHLECKLIHESGDCTFEKWPLETENGLVVTGPEQFKVVVDVSKEDAAHKLIKDSQGKCKQAWVLLLAKFIVIPIAEEEEANASLARFNDAAGHKARHPFYCDKKQEM